MKIILSILLFFPFISVGQQKVPVAFDFPSGNEYEIRIDEKKIYTEKNIKLLEGTHKVEIWVPGLLLITDTINVASAAKNEFIYRNKTRPEYFEYAGQLKRHNYKKGLMISSLTLTGLSMSASALTYIKANRLKDEYNNIKSQYISATDPLFFSSIDGKLSTTQRQYNINRSLYYSTLAFSVIVMPIISYLTIREFKKCKKPSSKFLDNPFKSKSTTFSFEFSCNNIHLALHL